jgi:hypothetical protein
MSILGHIGMVARSGDRNQRKGVTKWRLWIGETWAAEHSDRQIPPSTPLPIIP